MQKIYEEELESRIADTQFEASLIEDEDGLENNLYECLPDFWKRLCDVFSYKQDRDVFFFGSLAALSGILPNYYGVYDNKSVGSNLFLFIIASAGAGKGSLTWVRDLLSPIHEYLKEKDQTKKKMLFIPANNSSSGIIEALSKNDQRGILFCTEADTLSSALGQDWGNFSDLIRGVYHHEPYQMMRRGNSENIELNKAYMSILLSGTPNQLVNLIPNAENGLLSRFGFFSFKAIPRMKNVFAKNEINYDDHFGSFGKELLEFYKKIEEREIAISFSFTEDQKADFIDTYDDWHNEFYFLHGPVSLGIVRRLGLMQFRIAMIMSIMRYIKEDSIPSEIICNELDYLNSLMIVDKLKDNAKIIFQKYSDNKETQDLSGKHLQFIRMVPDKEFSRAEALKLAEKIDFSRPSLDRFLKTSFFKKVSHGIYMKYNRESE